ncbi:MAG: YaiI/YqxD family protein [Candidatus Hydrogenedentes bacterium]|nr:YaiI/YqxD family protein [Candidatus Hydrogenedentota bacterium]
MTVRDAHSEEPTSPSIFVDADGCPVKDEVYRVAKRYGLRVVLVANAWIRVPEEDGIELVVVDDGFDAADDWIVEHVRERDIVVTADIPLAARCLKQGAAALGPKGRVFTEASIGDALATREILSHMREHGTMTGGPAPFAKADRSRFLQRLDELVHANRR